MFISLYTTRLTLCALGVSDFGIFNVVGGAIAILGFLNSAMTSATQRFLSYSKGENDQLKEKKIFNISFVLHFGIAIFVGLLLLIAGWFFFHGLLNIQQERVFAAKVIYGSFVISTMFTVMSVPYDSLLSAHENMVFYAIIGVIESVLKLVASIAVVNYFGDKLSFYGILMSIIPIITIIITRYYCIRNYSECVLSPKQFWDEGLMKEMVYYAGWNLLGAASGMISQYGLTIVLNNFFGVILNAAQSIANQISGQLMVFSNTMLKALNPVIAKSEGSGNREFMLTASLKGSKFAFLLLSIFAVPFIIEAPYILELWLDDVPMWAVVFSRLQLGRSLIEQLTIMTGVAINAQGDIRSFSVLKSLLNITPIFVTYILFGFGFPPYYLYVTWILAGGILGGCVSLFYARKNCGLGIDVFFKMVVLPALLVTTLMFGIGVLPLFFMESSFYRLITVGGMTSLVMILSIYYFVATPDEKVIYSEIISRLKSKYKIS